jgi:site-specific DNA-methyltransferase (adenine-specific)
MQLYYEEAGITIYHGDCREILPTLEGDFAIVSDPPYGMKWDGKVTRGKNGTGKSGPTRNYGTSIAGDDEPFDPSFMLGYVEVILWGFNHYPQHLAKGTALVWLKRYDDGFGSFLSDAEIAWFNQGCGVYCKRDVSMQAESSNRVHPAQKPIDLMQWSIGFVKAETIADPYSGSGTTLVAAKNLGRNAIGIELEERYCEIAANRLRQSVLNFETVA